MPTLLFKKINSSKQFFFSLLLIVFVSGFCFVFRRYIDYKIVAFILLLTVSLLAVLFDIVPVLLSSILSAVIWNFFFIEPICQPCRRCIGLVCGKPAVVRSASCFDPAYIHVLLGSILSDDYKLGYGGDGGFSDLERQ